ncbi:MAG: SagB/ThcOx family dehydrogenase [Anaerolineae bacterium]|nr:SagB/ThcOx family dehydrogenase [Anaerolineae bacterium]
MSSPKVDYSLIKADAWEAFGDLVTDQRQGVPRPPLQAPHPEAAPLIDLIPPEDFELGDVPLRPLIEQRRSRRKYTDEAVTLQELSFLLWAAQGLRNVFREGLASFRMAPSAGARHPLEIYLVINRVEGIEPGLYRYLALEHRLCWLRTDPDLAEKAAEACADQIFVAHSAVTFVFVAVPYRTEWRYSIATPKLVALDAGHACQNLYLASESIGAGTCAIAAYNQTKMDALLGVDGEEQFAIYVASVGKVATRE